MDVKQLQVPDQIRSSLGSFVWDDRVHQVSYEGRKAKVHFYSDGLNLDQKSQVEEFLKQHLGDETLVYFERKNKEGGQVKPKEDVKRPQERAPSSKRPIPGVQKIIAVASGKGGVGKSTVSVNLALSLYQQGYKVGILDADIYGPSLPMMLGIKQAEPQVNEQHKILPILAHGLKVMSFGFFATDETAVIWRGPMVMKALQQFFYDVDWGELDVMIIDLPPGTGDAQLTLVQSLPLTGAVIVSTPQDVALLDAIKAIFMFQKTQVPVLGFVENMSVFECPHCHEVSEIFGAGGGERVEKQYHVPLLGKIPLVKEVRMRGDAGNPITLDHTHVVRTVFMDLADEVMKQVSAQTSQPAEL